MAKIKPKLQKDLRFTTCLENAFTSGWWKSRKCQGCQPLLIAITKSQKMYKMTFSIWLYPLLPIPDHFFFSGALSKNPLSPRHLRSTGLCRKSLPWDIGSGHHHQVRKHPFLSYSFILGLVLRQKTRWSNVIRRKVNAVQSETHIPWKGYFW